MTSTPSHSRLSRMVERARKLIDFISTGIWSDPRRNWKLTILRTLNLSVKSFMSRDIQSRACAMTYRTMLAIVPALALFVAIGRGFGMQELLQQELYKLFPAQKVAIHYAMSFVDSYMATTSEGIFVGIGILFLLYTLISLISSVEDTFNFIWGQKQGRSIWRKISDYTAMLLILPILMLCAGGLSVLLSSTLDRFFGFEFLTPVISLLLESAQWLMTVLFFTALYALVPNVRVKFVNALVSGVLAGSAFLVLQWLFVTGTLYVTRYNAIYGSFAFLPLMLLWLQLVWVICLAGAVICYSSQNVFAFNLDKESSSVSRRYADKVTVAVAAVLAHRFLDRERPITAECFITDYGFPARLVADVTERLVAAGICSHVVIEGEKDTLGLQLSVDPSTLTVAGLLHELALTGSKGFVTGFDVRFKDVETVFAAIDSAVSVAGSTLVADIALPSPRG